MESLSRTNTQPHLKSSDISPSAKLLHDILITSSPSEVESSLNSSGIPPTNDLIHEVLKLSYSNPSSAIKFFRWAGRFHKPTPYAWNLMIDVLGKNSLFDSMWGAIRSMRKEELLSVSTFSSVFGSYCLAGRFREAIMSFEVMNDYDIVQDVIAVNSLLSALCTVNDGVTTGMEFYESVKKRIPPNEDTYGILLEGCEKIGNGGIAKRCFEEMVKLVGWSNDYECAYESFLMTLIRGGYAEDAVMYLGVMKEKGCMPRLKFFINAIDVLAKENNGSCNVVQLWDVMMENGILPDLIMYNSVIRLICDSDDVDNAFRLLDEMVFYGAFPDSRTYGLIFRCLIKNKKVQLVGKFFYEMVKNEITPTGVDCCAAITILVDDDPEIAIEIWNYMVENDVLPLDESANVLLTGFCNMGRASEVGRLLEDMLNRRVIIYETTMTRFKYASLKEGGDAKKNYDVLLQRWKSC